MSYDYSENILVQGAAGDLLHDELGWDLVYAHNQETLGPNGMLGRTDYREVLLTKYLRPALFRLNSWMTEAYADSVVKSLLETSFSATPMQTNELKYRLITGGVPVDFRLPNGNLEKRLARVIDFDNPANDHFLAVKEMKIHGTLYHRRADIIGFVNGIPLLFIELKKMGVDVREAYDNNYHDYQHTIPQLFRFNAFVMLSNGVESKVGTLGSEYDFFNEWKRLEEQEKQLRPITRKCRTLVNTKESQGGAANMIFAYFHTFFLLDLIEYSSVVSGVKSYEKAILQMAEDLGLLDFALSAASYRESLSYYCRPEFLDEKKAGCRIDVEELYHPLLTHPVANSLYAEGGILLTGSNASGKSTFMKNMAVNAILAQALNTSLSKRYRGVVCRIMTSMALRDNLAQGESYFVVEAKSLKRILEASREKTPLLCVIDEVLRGTNTTERIAASESVLAALRRANVLCLAATHDTELTYLLEDLYTNYHFEEQITAQSISFPYRLEQGPARGKNAIALLGNMGIDEKIVKQAERRAAEFETTGSWEKNKFLR